MGAWDAGIKLVTDNWNKIITSPRNSAIVAFLIGCVVTYIFVTWHFDGTLQSKDTTIQAKDATIQSKEASIQELEKRISGKDELMNVYRMKMNEITAAGTAFTLLTNDELKRQTLTLVKQMREFLNQKDTELRLAIGNEFESISNARTEDERQTMLFNYVSKSDQQTRTFLIDYDKQFKSKSILLRDELLSRLSNQERKNILNVFYEHPTNPLMAREICDNLEQLALKLPKPSQYERQTE